MFSEKNIGGVRFMVSSALDGSVHAFTTRFGGVSRGIYESLDLGVRRGDDPQDVLENYDRICAALGTKKERMILSAQVHGTTIRAVTREDCPGDVYAEVPACDGLITNEPGLPLVIFTADCIPILLFDPVKRAVGAVHAGWRGTVAGIAECAVKAMAEHYGSSPENIRAAIGPGISKCCFETDGDVPDGVMKALPENGAEFVRPVGEKYYVDLKGVNRAILLRAGLCPENIDISNECTVCSCDKYWSHRVTRGERGSQAEIIMLTNE